MVTVVSCLTARSFNYGRQPLSRLILLPRVRVAAVAGKIEKEAPKPGEKPKKVDKDSFMKILNVIIPQLKSKHGAYFAAYVASLASRVFVTVKLADIGGKSGGYFGARQWDKMFEGQAIFGCWCMVGAVTTAAMKYLEKRVSLSVREILYQHSVKQYLDPKELAYFRVDLNDPQARLTTDIERYAKDATHLLGYFLKPSIDVMHLAVVLTQRIGFRSLAIFLSFFYFSNFALTRVKNSLAKSLKQCAIETQQLESALRIRHQKIHDAREQIALQRGTAIEMSELQSRFKALISHLEFTNRQ